MSRLERPRWVVELVEELVDGEVDDCWLPELLVEYFEVVLDVEFDDISVPNPEHESHTWSSAPSILAVVGEAVSVPHISHWTISGDQRRPT